MESTTTQRVTIPPPAAYVGKDDPIQVMDAALERSWATSEPLLLLVRTEHFSAQQTVFERLQAKASEFGAWALTADANVIGLDGPYGSLLRALTLFVPRIATEPGSLGASIRHRLGQTADLTGRLLTNFCPAFSTVVNAKNEPETLSFGSARDRLETLLVRVFAALSPAEPPVVFFLRHAAHADAATLRSLSRVLTHAETRQLAVVALVDAHDKPRDEHAWRSFISTKKYVVERYDYGTTNSADTGPSSGTVTTSLDADTRRVLEAVACNGQWAELEAISEALGISASDVSNLLVDAMEAGFLRRYGTGYAFLDPHISRVCHDEIEPSVRGPMHLRLGKFLALPRPQSSDPHVRFVAAGHLVMAIRDGALATSSDAERKYVAEVLLDAGQKAIEMVGHDVAHEYLEAAVAALVPGDDLWTSPFVDLASPIDFARLECACATSNHLRAQVLFDTLCNRVPNAPQMATAWRWMVELATRSGEHKTAIERADQALVRCGIRLQTAPTPETIKKSFDAVWDALGDRAIEEIVDLERMTNRDALEATEMLFMAHPSAQALGAGPSDLVACHLSRLALLNGNADASSVGHAALGAAIIGRQKDHRTGTRLGKVALQLCEQRGTHRHHTAVAMKFAAAMSIWTHPLQNSIDQCVRTYEIALASGDSRSATRIASMIAYLTLLQGTTLDEVSEEALRRRRAIRGHGCDDEGMGELCDAIERFVGLQKGRSIQRRTKSGIWPGELRLGHVACRVIDIMALVLAQEYEAALFASANLSKTIADIGSQILVAEYWFWTTLASTFTRTSGLPDRLDEVIQDFEHWADRCPQTFQHKHALLVAERARLEGRDMEAMRAYDQALNEARENGFSHLEAVTAEAATRFYLTRDFPLIAGTYFRTARSAYGRWGASAKVLQIDRRFPKLSGVTEQFSSTAPPSLRSSTDMDVFTAVKVAQAVSKEIVLQRLLVTLMKIVTEHVAAERCHVLLQLENGEWNHAGKVSTTSKGLEIEVPGPAFKSIGDILPASMLEQVRIDHQPVCLDDAVLEQTWADDPYIASHRPRSVVCFPILRQSTIVGVFYLENNSGRGMFGPRRLALLEFLANQASISFEHAKLYADLARENSERRRAEQVLRRSEERMRRLIETADVIPWEVDADTGVFTYIGAQAEKRLGWPAAAWKKANFLQENVHPDNRPEVLTAFAKACADGKHAGIDFRLFGLDGESVWLHMVIGSVEQENGQRLLSGFFFDITERKESEQTLRDKLDIIEKQKNDIRALSTPLLDVSEGIVAMPVLGELDEERAGRIMNVLLETITKRNVRGAILDLTGVSSISNATADQIGRIVRAVELVGARAIVAGIRADVARAIIALDVGLGQITTRASMKDALRFLVQGGSTSRTVEKNHSRSSR